MDFFREIRLHKNFHTNHSQKNQMLFKRKKIFFLLLGYCFLSPLSMAQKRVTDSLKSELTKEDLPDTSRINILIKLGDQLGYADAPAAIAYLKDAYQLAKSKNLYVKMGDALTGFGQAYYRTDDLDSCLYFLKQADSLYKKSNSFESKISLISSKMNMATVLRSQGNSSTALPIYLEGLDSLNAIKKFAGKDLKLAIAYSNIGLLFFELGQYDKALSYHRKGVEIAEKNNLNDIRSYYLKMHFVVDFIKLKKYDSARIYLLRYEKPIKDLNQPDVLSQLYSSWGFYYAGMKQQDLALESFNNSYTYSLKSKNGFRQEQMLARIADIYKEKKDYEKSVSYFLKAYKLSLKLKDRTSDLEYLKDLSYLNGELGHDHKAVKYYRQYILLSDSLNEVGLKKKVDEIENKYQAEKKEASIIALQKDNQLQKSTLDQRRTFIISLIAGCILLLFVASLFYKNFKTKNRLLLQSEKLHQQQLSELETERKLEAAEFVMKGQEEERSRLAKDLHDGVGGLLSGVKLSMSNMKGNVFLSEENAHSFNNVISQLDQSIAELRRVSHNMMPEALVKYGLKEALENYCENLNLSGKIKVQLQIYNMEKRMEQNTEIVIYRIVQELLNNVIKHADAKSVLIQLSREKDRFNLTVEDDGKGFNISEHTPGAGLANIKARAEYLNGSVDIISAKGEGTSVNIEGDAGNDI